MSLQIALLASLVLFTIGIVGVLIRRDILRILISVSIILGSITLLLVALSATQQTVDGLHSNQSFVLFVWAVEVMEVLVAIAIFLYLARSNKSDINSLQQLKW